MEIKAKCKVNGHESDCCQLFSYLYQAANLDGHYFLSLEH